MVDSVVWQDDEAVIDARMAEAISEMSHYGAADYLIINDDFERALVEFQALVAAEQLKLRKQVETHKSLLYSAEGRETRQ